MAEWSKARVSNIVNGVTCSGVQIPLSPPFFLQKMANEDASLLFTVRSTTSLKRRSLFFTSSPNPGEDLLVKSFHSAIAPFHLWRGQLALPVKFSRCASKDGVTFIQRFAYTAASRLDFFFLRWYTDNWCHSIQITFYYAFAIKLFSFIVTRNANVLPVLFFTSTLQVMYHL